MVAKLTSKPDFEIPTSAQLTNDGQRVPVLRLQNMTVQRGDFPLCSQVDLSLNQGDICHLTGANGTGKTTLMMQLTGLLPLLEGKVTYQGQEGLPIAPLYISHQLGIHPNLSVAQNLTFLLNLYGIMPTSKQIDEALSWVDLPGYERMSSNQLSAGQTRRVTLARLYLMSPIHAPLWLLDEPFTALDTDMVKDLQERIQAFALSGGAVLMTSHQPINVATKHLNLSEYLPVCLSENDDIQEGDSLENNSPKNNHLRDSISKDGTLRNSSSTAKNLAKSPPYNVRRNDNGTRIRVNQMSGVNRSMQ